MALETELVLFYRPNENRKNLFITNIESAKDEVAILTSLRDAFSNYGLINDVLVFESHLPSQFTRLKRKSLANETIHKQQYYAIVKFYLAISAKRALKEVAVRFDGQTCKVNYSNRREVNLHQQLYVNRCYELANYYLGFDGWSTRITKMWMEDGGSDVRCVCHVQLSVTHHYVSCTGVGVWQEAISRIADKGGLCRKSHRIAYNRAVESAFSKLVLVVLGDGRVYADVNVANDSPTEVEYADDDASLLQVTEGAGILADEDIMDNDGNDDLNVNILRELEQS